MSGVAALGGFLAGTAIKGAALLTVTTMCAVALRRSSAAHRHLLWWVALVGLLALPAASALLPSWGIFRWSASSSAPAAVSVSVPTIWGEKGAVARRSAVAEPDTAAHPDHEAGDVPAAPALNAGSPARGQTGASRTIAAWALGGWVAGVLFVLLGLAGERLRVARIAGRARPVPPGGRIDRVARRMAARIGIEQLPRLRIGDAGLMPMTWGVRRPLVLLPGEARDWLDARLEVVLLHEFAHVRRRDYLTQVLGTVACALHWFNPLAWVALDRLRYERELACDDEVLAVGSRPSGYASELLELARAMRTRRATSLTVLAMAHPTQLTDRLAAVLDETRYRTRLTRSLFGRAVAVAFLVILPLAMLGPVERVDAVDVKALDPAGVDAELVLDPAQSIPEPTESRPDADTPIPEAETRTRYMAEPDGVDELLNGVERLGPDSIQKTYLLDVADEVELDASELARILRTAADVIGSDSIMRDLLVELVRRRPGLLRDDGLAAFREAARTIGSDAEHGTMLLAILDLQAGDPEVLATLLTSAADGIGSDTEMGRFLFELAARYPGELGNPGYWAAAATIDSDAELLKILILLAESATIRGPALVPALETARARIGLEGEMRTFLVHLVRGRPAVGSGASAEAFWASVDAIGSDPDQARVLAALSEETDDAETLAGLLDAARRGLGSDDEMSRFLVTFATRHRASASGPLREAYLSAVGTIGSDSLRERVLAAMDR